MRTPLVRAAGALLAAGLAAAVRPAGAQGPSQCDAVRANLVANCGFERGSFAGYTLAGNTANIGVDAFSSNSGAYGAYFADRGAPLTLTQTLATNPGEQYVVSFFLESDAQLPGTAFFNASFDGVQGFSQVGQTSLSYASHTFTVRASAFQTVLRFDVRNDPSFYYLDDVSVVGIQGTIPEPATVALVGAGLLGVAAAARRPRVTTRLGQ